MGHAPGSANGWRSWQPGRVNGYAFFIFGYGNEVLQVFLPSISQDRCIDGKPLSLPPFPTPGTPDPVHHGRPTKVEDRKHDARPD